MSRKLKSTCKIYICLVTFKSVEEQQQNKSLKDRLEIMEIDLESERKKVFENERKIKSLEANLFDAGHQLREALKTANHAANLKAKYNTIQKRFLLFREVNIQIPKIFYKN